MLARGVTYPMLLELLKSVFVRVAEDDFGLPGKAPTDSRISLLTGVHRKDVRRLRSATESSDVPAAVPLGAQLVAAWLTLPGHSNKRGKPLPLPRLSSSGASASFESLVAGVSKDIRSRVVLDEWLRLGVVHLDEDDRVVLNTQAFVPQRGFEEKLFYFGHNLSDHAAAAGHNVLDQTPPFLERAVHYDRLTAESAEELAQLAEQAGMEAALAVNRRAQELEARDANSESAKRRIRFGIYFYSAPMDERSSGGTAAKPREDS